MILIVDFSLSWVCYSCMTARGGRGGVEQERTVSKAKKRKKYGIYLVNIKGERTPGESKALLGFKRGKTMWRLSLPDMALTAMCPFAQLSTDARSNLASFSHFRIAAGPLADNPNKKMALQPWGVMLVYNRTL